MTGDTETARRLIGLVDLTSLNDARDDDIAALCGKAVTRCGPVAAVCSWPEFARDMVRHLAGQSPKVAVVIDFPGGGGEIGTVLAQAKQALDDGAQELDLVWPYRAWMAGERQKARDLVTAVKEVAGGARLKVILETGVIEDLGRISDASRDAIEAGADMLKTSTGKTAQGASLPAAGAMLHAIRASRRDVGFKASGGIGTLEQATGYLNLAEDIMGAGWATERHFRIGASRVLDQLLNTIP